MSNLGLIIKREYITRVRKKSFIIISLLAPFGILLLLFLPALIEIFGSQTETSVAVVDHTNYYGKFLQTDNVASFSNLPSDLDEDVLRQMCTTDDFDAYMLIEGSPASKDSVKIFSNSTLTIDLVSKIENDLRNGLRERCLSDYSMHSAQLDSLFNVVNKQRANVTTINVSKDGSDSESSVIVGFLVSVIVMFLIYTFVLVSGSMVMSSVMEEKNSRIIEVLVASVKPFDLMMGKIIGVALTTLTQFAIWFVIGTMATIVATVVMPTPDVDVLTQSSVAMTEQVDEGVIIKIMQMLSSINIFEILVLFVVYFIGGYLLYASFFACIGAAVENQSDGQQLMLPLTMIIIVALYIALYAAKDPNGTISIVGSMIPFTSPIVMMARIPFGVSIWQILLSILILVGSFVLSTWVAARIYRVGILMYGKKPSIQEIWKWFKQSN